MNQVNSLKNVKMFNKENKKCKYNKIYKKQNNKFKIFLNNIDKLINYTNFRKKFIFI